MAYGSIRHTVAGHYQNKSFNCVSALQNGSMLTPQLLTCSLVFSKF